MFKFLSCMFIQKKDIIIINEPKDLSDEMKDIKEVIEDLSNEMKDIKEVIEDLSNVKVIEVIEDLSNVKVIEVIEDLSNNIVTEFTENDIMESILLEDKINIQTYRQSDDNTTIDTQDNVSTLDNN